jgi:UDP-glucose 4-epimerase
VTVHGDGEQTRDFVNVADVVRANLLAATTDATGEAFNVGTGVRTSIRRVAELVRGEVDPNVAVTHTDPREGDIGHSVADIDKAADRLGYEPDVALADGLGTYLSSRR